MVRQAGEDRQTIGTIPLAAERPVLVDKSLDLVKKVRANERQAGFAPKL